eukprot:662388-Hanusia_phi.AAC.1
MPPSWIYYERIWHSIQETGTNICPSSISLSAALPEVRATAELMAVNSNLVRDKLAELATLLQHRKIQQWKVGDQ